MGLKVHSWTRTMKRILLALVIPWSLVGAPLPAVAQSAGAEGAAPVHECDSLATFPGDPQGVEEAVRWADLDAGAAVVACQEAIGMFPDEPRFRFLYGRALIKAERYGEAMTTLALAELSVVR